MASPLNRVSPRASPVLAIVMCVLLNALDGYDIMAISFAAPAMAADWKLHPAAVGAMLSAGLAGMITGALFVAPSADRLGRRPVTIGCVGVIASGMVATAFAPNYYWDAIARFLTGLALGGLAASLIAMVVEYSHERYRALATGFLTGGFSFGGMVGGLVASHVLARQGWPAIFLTGGIGGLIVLPWLVLKLPESERLSAAGRAVGGSSLKALFAEGYRTQTIMLVIVQLCHFVTFYYLTSWAPSIVVRHGYPPSDGALVAAALNGGAIVAGLSVGWFAGLIGIKRLVCLTMLGSGLFVMSLAVLPFSLTTMKLLCFIIGFFFIAANSSFYTALACAYDARWRVSGAGVVTGIGRVGAVIGPSLAGLLLQIGVSSQGVIAAMALGSIVAALTMSRLALRDRMVEEA